MLHSLGEADALALASGILGTADFPDELKAALLEKAEGVPLFVEEVVKTLLDVGVLRREDKGYRIARSLAEVDVPDTIQGIIMARLDRLGEAGKRTMQVASVIGRQFLVRLLEHLVEEIGQLEEILTELQALEMISRQWLLPEPAYMFKHAMMQDVAYNSLLLRRRQELHRAVGYAIEALYPGRLAEHYAELAHHFTQGEMWPKALEYSTLAGDRAAEAFANVEAKAHYMRALHATAQMTPPADAGVVARLHAKQGAILEPLGEYEAAITAWERALERIRQTGERQEEIDILVGLSGTYNSAHREAPAMHYSRQALALARALEDRARLAVCLIQRAAIRSVASGQLVEALPEAEEALRLARDIGEPQALAQALVFLGSLLQWRAEFDRSLVYLREGVALAQQTHAGSLLGNAAFCLGHARAAQGAYEDAFHWYQQLNDYAVAAHDTFWLARLPNTVGGVHLELFNSAEALRLNLEGEESAQQYSAWPEPRGHCVVKAGLAYLQQGHHGHAEACFRRAETLIEADTWMRWQWHMALLRAWGELALAQGHPDDAWTYACQSFDLATRSHSRKHMARAQLLQGDVLRVGGRLGEAAHTLEAAIPCSQKIRGPLSNSGYPRSDAHLTGFLRGAGAGCLPEILQLPPPQEEGHLLQRTAPLSTAVVQSPRGWPGHTPSAAHRRPAAGVYAARHKPA